ncbi:MAG: twin-arginine translocation signal domain-containing protein, partial [Acetobacteraceae bacterium]|nr:twin-arginine translocation signal domain-containing protein [Acetobacteraceae bacterium]
MERRNFLKASALGVAATTVAAGSEAQNAPPFPAPPTVD